MTSSVETQPAEDRRFFGQPRGLAILFQTELWERFSYYGMKAILVFFMIAPASQGGLGLAKSLAVGVVGLYVALVYLLPVLGGWLADRVIGTRAATLWGGVVIASGHYTMALPTESTIWLGLLLIAVGTGLLKPNISTMVGQLYTKTDERRDAGFTIFYMAINIGAFASPLLTGPAAKSFGYHMGFGIAAVGMTIAVVVYALGLRGMGSLGKEVPQPLAAGESRTLAVRGLGILAALLVVHVVTSAVFQLIYTRSFSLGGSFNLPSVLDTTAVVGIGLPIIYFRWMFTKVDAEYRSKLWAYVWFFAAAALFWLIYDQFASQVAVFTEDKVDRMLFSYDVPAASYQSINPIFIILLAPLFAAVWQQMGPRQPSTPVKFAFSMLVIGLSFVVMSFAGGVAAGGAKVGAWIIVFAIVVQTVAEMFLSPVGLSVTTKLAAPQFASQMMALWFLAVMTGNAVIGQVVKLNDAYGDVLYYGGLGGVAIVSGLVFLAYSGRIKSLMGDVH